MSLKRSVKPVVASLVLGLVATSQVALAHQAGVKQEPPALHKLAMQVLSNGNGYYTHAGHRLGSSMIDWSGIASVDVNYGSRGDSANLVDFDAIGTSRTDVRLDHIVLAANAKVSPWVRFRAALGFVEQQEDGYNNFITLHGKHHSAEHVVIDEGYINIGNRCKSPVYFQVGREWTDFGYYANSYPLTPSLVQSLVQSNQTTIKLGFVDNSGFMASISAFNDVASNDDGRSRISNFIAKLAYADKHSGVSYRVDGSYVRDIRDIGIISQDTSFYASDKLTGAYALHAGLSYDDLSGRIDYVSALGDIMGSGTESHVSALGAEVSYKFRTSDWHSYFKLGYQLSSQGEFISEGIYALPKHRCLAAYNVSITKYADATLQYVHDAAYTAEGQGKSANSVALRFSVQF